MSKQETTWEFQYIVVFGTEFLPREGRFKKVPVLLALTKEHYVMKPLESVYLQLNHTGDLFMPKGDDDPLNIPLLQVPPKMIVYLNRFKEQDRKTFVDSLAIKISAEEFVQHIHKARIQQCQNKETTCLAKNVNHYCPEWYPYNGKTCRVDSSSSPSSTAIHVFNDVPIPATSEKMLTYCKSNPSSTYLHHVASQLKGCYTSTTQWRIDVLPNENDLALVFSDKKHGWTWKTGKDPILWQGKQSFAVLNKDRIVRLLACKKRFVFVELTFRFYASEKNQHFQTIPGFREKVYGHANMIWMDMNKRIIHRFEPHGTHTEWEDDADVFMERLAQEMTSVDKKTWSYMEPQIYCGFSGPQKEEEKTSKSGFCQCWSTMLAHLQLLNPDLTPSTIVEQMRRGGSLQFDPVWKSKTNRKRVLEYIHRYSHVINSPDIKKLPVRGTSYHLENIVTSPIFLQNIVGTSAEPSMEMQSKIKELLKTKTPADILNESFVSTEGILVVSQYIVEEMKGKKWKKDLFISRIFIHVLKELSKQVSAILKLSKLERNQLNDKIASFRLFNETQIKKLRAIVNAL